MNSIERSLKKLDDLAMEAVYSVLFKAKKQTDMFLRKFSEVLACNDKELNRRFFERLELTDEEYSISDSRIDEALEDKEPLTFDSTALVFVLMPFDKTRYILHYLAVGDSYGLQIKNCHDPRRLNTIEFNSVRYPSVEVQEIYQASNNVSVITNRPHKSDLPNLGSKIVEVGDTLLFATDGVELFHETNQFVHAGYTFQQYLVKYGKTAGFAEKWYDHQVEGIGMYDDFSLVTIHVNKRPKRKRKCGIFNKSRRKDG